MKRFDRSNLKRWHFAAPLSVLAAFGVFVTACSEGHSKKSDAGESRAVAADPQLVPSNRSKPVPMYGYQIVTTWPHDPEAFTQGLVYLKGILIESTGLNGLSSLRKVDLQSGRVRQELKLGSEYFGEGMTVLGSRIYQLTWQNHKGFIYDLDRFSKVREFDYEGEGWGLTTDGHSLIMSDGSNRLRFLDPETCQVVRTIRVFNAEGKPQNQLNELEFIEGEIFANVWQTPYVVRIDPKDGALLGVVDFNGLLSPGDFGPTTDVLNGIAYDPESRRIFVTGKNWPKLFEVRLTPR